MKKYLHCLIAIVSVSAFAQNFQGIAVYESKTTFNFDEGEKKTEGDQLSPEIEAQIQEQLKKAFEKTYTLKFDKSASLYKEEEKLNDPSGDGTVIVSVSFNGGGMQYKNLKDQTSLTETEIFGKEFLITDGLEKLDWKMSGDTKKIGNYTCYKATAVVNVKQSYEVEKAVTLTTAPPKDTNITAWYTPDIPVSHGPADYWGLPGLILEVNDGQTILLCSKITLNPKEKFEIKAPKKGSKVTRKEFEDIMHKKSKEIEEMNDGPAAPGTTRTTKVIRIGG